MPKDIGDILPTVEQLEGEKMDKEALVDKVMTIKDFVLLTSTFEGTDNFCVLQADMAGKLITFSGGAVLTKKFQNIGREAVKEAGGIKGKLVKTKSKKGGRAYFDFVSAK